ncbi:hypothetical protein G3M48_005057 [Beauveria asiatica]|uniref:Uncharacterized protein n=1 Tax=Beauveria asiatica TaxID=1069075 RepID=A0AAW0RSR6_9HYPO
MYMSSQHTQLAQTNTTTSKDDAVAAFLNNQSGINRLVRTNRQCRRAVNKCLYKFDLLADKFDLSRGTSTRNALYVVASLGDVAMARLLLEFAQADFRSSLVLCLTTTGATAAFMGKHNLSLPYAMAMRASSGHCATTRASTSTSRAPTTRAPVFYALTQFRWHIFDVLVARGAMYDAELAFELAWMLRLIQTTTFDETRLDYWYKTSYALLNECKYWQMVELELNQQKKAFLRSWRQDNALLWGEHATRSIERGENGGI